MATMRGAFISLALSIVAISLLPRLSVPAQPKPPVVYTTPAKRAEAAFRLETADSSPGEMKIDGRVSYTLTAASDDDSLRGTFTILLSGPGRQTLADASNLKLAEIPESYSRPDTIAKFANGTSCPSIELNFPEFQIKAGKGNLVMSGKLLEIRESADRLIQQLCFWTRQINVKRERIGIIRSINRMIEGDKAG